jgi:hypothetical protein
MSESRSEFKNPLLASSFPCSEFSNFARRSPEDLGTRLHRLKPKTEYLTAQNSLEQRPLSNSDRLVITGALMILSSDGHDNESSQVAALRKYDLPSVHTGHCSRSSILTPNMDPFIGVKY